MAELRLGVCTWSLRAREARTLAEQTAELGLAGVQMDLDRVIQAPDVWESMPAVFAERGLAIGSGMMRCIDEDYASIPRIRETGGLRPNGTWQANRERAKAVAEVARRWGLGAISLHLGFLPAEADDPLTQTMADRARETAAIFGDAGAQLLLETGQEAPEVLAAFLSRLSGEGVGNIGVNFDPANMLLYGSGQPLEAFELLRPWIRQVHVKDAEPSGWKDVWGRETAVGEGQAPWRELVERLRASAFGGWLMIEREAGDERMSEVRKAAAVVREAAGRGGPAGMGGDGGAGGEG